MYRVANTIIVRGWIFLSIGLLGLAVSSFGLMTLQNNSDPFARQRNAERIVQRSPQRFGYVDKKDAVTAVQQSFLRGLLMATLSLLLGFGYLSRRPSGWRLCAAVIGLWCFWSVWNGWRLLQGEVAWPVVLRMGLPSMIGLSILCWDLLRPSTKAQFGK